MIPAAPLSSPIRTDAAFRSLKDHVIGATGLAYYRERESDLAEHVLARLSHLGLPDVGAYLHLLQSEPGGEAELEALTESLTIGETFFFRHEELFDALRERVIPDVMRRRQARPLRIWSAGCSIGAEPYSLSILLTRALRGRTNRPAIDILGTDINRGFLARAREGLFDEWTLRGMPDDVRRECFLREGRTWRIAPEYRECVRFQYHNLVRHPFPSLVNNLVAFDIILCRNVMIYMAGDVTRRVVAGFHGSLVDGGWLLVGHAEPNADLFRSFRTINAPGAVLYARDDSDSDGSASSAAGRRPDAAVFSPAVPPPAMHPQAIALPRTPISAAAQPVRHVPGPTPGVGGSDRPRVGALDSVREAADRGDLTEAIRRCGERLEMNGLDPVLHLYLGMLLGQLGQQEESERSLKRAIYLDRGCVLAHYHVGLVHQKRGRSGPAAHSFQNVLELLADRDDKQVIPDADDMTVADLTVLSRMHLAVLGGA